MSNVCQCCGTKMNTSKCNYCGFVEIIDMDGSGTELVQSMAANHKKNIVGAITDLCVVSYSYKWNEAKSRLEMDKKEELKLADGVDCYPGMKWTSQAFGQLPAGKDITLEISYKFRGAKKKLSCTIPTVQCDDFWKVGMVIDQSLKLKIFLGTEKNHTESSAFDLELK